MKKNNIIKLLVFIFVLILTPSVHAASVVKTCYYEYFSEAYGLSRAELKIYTKDHYGTEWFSSNYKPGFHDGTITMFNGDSMSNNETVHDYSGYVNRMLQDNTCPYFLDINGGSNMYLEASYSLDGFDDNSENYEKHIACSSTIAQDMPNYDPSMCSHEKEDAATETNKNRNLLYTCTYNYNENGYTSAVLNIYDDYENKEDDAYITVFNGSSMDGAFDNNHMKLENWSSLVSQIKSKKECPYYMIADVEGSNQLEAGYSKDDLLTRWTLSTNTHLLVSTTISDDKDDYNQEEDGKAITKEDEVERVGEANYEEKSGRNDDYDPGDPYESHIGDQFCGQEEVVKAIKVIGILIILAKFAVPIIIIFIGTIDLSKVVVSGKEDVIKKQFRTLGWRVVLGLLIMFSPTLINAILSGLAYYQVISEDINRCQNCLLNPLGAGNCQTNAEGGGNTAGASDKTVDYTNINTDNPEGSNAEAGKLNPNADTVEAGKLNPNNETVDAGKINPNNSTVTASEINTNKDVNAGDTNSNNKVVYIQEPEYTKSATIN